MCIRDSGLPLDHRRSKSDCDWTPVEDEGDHTPSTDLNSASPFPQSPVLNTWVSSCTAKSVLSRYLRGKPLIEPSVPAAASRAAPPLRNRIDPMEEEGAVGQRSRRSPSPRRSPPAVEGVLVGDEGGDIESRPTHVTGGMGDERERCALRRRLRRARGRRKPRSRSTPRCNGSLASIQLSRQQKWGWSGWGWMPIEGERLQLRPVAAAPCGS